MTDEVYLAIEDTNTIVNIRVDTPKPEKTILKEENRTSRASSNKVEESRTPKSREERLQKITRIDNTKPSTIENRDVVSKHTENRQFNSNLRDLIKILILFRLFGNRPNRPRPPRPPFPGGPGRPPFQGGMPPMGPGRPPIQPRDYNNYLEY